MIQKIVNFGLVGVFATVIDMVALYILTSLLGLDVYLSTPLAFSLGLIFNYIMSMKYVFKAKEGLTKQKQMVIFIITALIGLAINQAVMYIGTDLLQIDAYMLIKIVATGIVMVFSFVSRYVLLERK